LKPDAVKEEALEPPAAAPPATVCAAPRSHLLRSTGARSRFTWTRSRPTRDHVVGSVIFGVGWSIACTCPGPIAAQIGSGQLAGLFTAAGLLGGVAIRGWQRDRATARAAVEPSTATAGL